MDHYSVDVSGAEVVVVIDTTPAFATVITAPHAHGIDVGGQVYDAGIAGRNSDVADVTTWWICNLS